MTSEGYPEDAELERIATWDHRDLPGLMQFVGTLWQYPEFGWREVATSRGTLFTISTAGWSGNEEIISALHSNRLFWMLSWQSSRRGGHHEFELRKPEANA